MYYLEYLHRVRLTYHVYRDRLAPNERREVLQRLMQSACLGDWNLLLSLLLCFETCYCILRRSFEAL